MSAARNIIPFPAPEPHRDSFALPKERLARIWNDPADNAARRLVALHLGVKATTPHPRPENRSEPWANALPTPSCKTVEARRLASLVAAAKKVGSEAEWRGLVQAIQETAVREKWNRSEIEQHTGLSRRAFSRILAGEVEIVPWLRRLRAAVEKLKVGRDAPRAPQPEELAP